MAENNFAAVIGLVAALAAGGNYINTGNKVDAAKQEQRHARKLEWLIQQCMIRELVKANGGELRADLEQYCSAEAINQVRNKA